MTKLPTKTQSAEAGSTYPTHRARDGPLTNGTARSTAPTSQASSPRANATTNPEGVGDEPATSRGACSASHGSTSATAPTKTRRPPNLDSRVPVTVPTSQTLSCLARTARPCPGRGYEPPGLGACNGRTTSSSSSLCPPSLRATDETTRACTVVSCLYTVHVHRTAKGYLYGVQLSRDGSEKSRKCY